MFKGKIHNIKLMPELKNSSSASLKNYPIYTVAFETTKLKGSILDVIWKATEEKFSDGKGCDVGDHSCNKFGYILSFLSNYAKTCIL